MKQQELFKLKYISYQQWLKRNYDEALQQIEITKVSNKQKGGIES